MYNFNRRKKSNLNCRLSDRDRKRHKSGSDNNNFYNSPFSGYNHNINTVSENDYFVTDTCYLKDILDVFKLPTFFIIHD